MTAIRTDALTVIGNKRGEYRVSTDLGGTGSILAGPFETSAEAWRWIDRYQGEPINRAEQTAEWVFKKMTVEARHEEPTGKACR